MDENLQFTKEELEQSMQTITDFSIKIYEEGIDFGFKMGLIGSLLGAAVAVLGICSIDAIYEHIKRKKSIEEQAE